MILNEYAESDPINNSEMREMKETKERGNEKKKGEPGVERKKINKNKKNKEKRNNKKKTMKKNEPRTQSTSILKVASNDERNVKFMQESGKECSVGINFICYGGAFTKFAKETNFLNKKKNSNTDGMHMNDYFFHNSLFRDHFIKLVSFSRWHILLYLSNNKLYYFTHGSNHKCGRYSTNQLNSGSGTACVESCNQWKHISVPSLSELVSIHIASCNDHEENWGKKVIQHTNKCTENKAESSPVKTENEHMCKTSINYVNMCTVCVIDSDGYLYVEHINNMHESDHIIMKQVEINLSKPFSNNNLKYNTLFVSVPELEVQDTYADSNMVLKYAAIIKITYDPVIQMAEADDWQSAGRSRVSQDTTGKNASKTRCLEFDKEENNENRTGSNTAKTQLQIKDDRNENEINTVDKCNSRYSTINKHGNMRKRKITVIDDVQENVNKTHHCSNGGFTLENRKCRKFEETQNPKQGMKYIHKKDISSSNINNETSNVAYISTNKEREENDTSLKGDKKKITFLYIHHSNDDHFKVKLIKKPQKLICGTAAKHGCVLFEDNEIYFWHIGRKKKEVEKNEAQQSEQHIFINGTNTWCRFKKANIIGNVINKQLKEYIYTHYVIFQRLKTPKCKMHDVVYCNNTYVMLSEDKTIHILKEKYLNNLNALNISFYLSNPTYRKLKSKYNLIDIVEKIKTQKILKMYLTDYLLITVHSDKEVNFIPIFFKDIYEENGHQIYGLTFKYKQQIKQLLDGLVNLRHTKMDKNFLIPKKKKNNGYLKKYETTIIKDPMEKSNFTFYVSPNAFIVCVYNIMEYCNLLNLSVHDFLKQNHVV